MVSKVTMLLEHGLTTKEATEFVQLTSRYESNITIGRNGKFVNAKSIMGVMSLAIPNGVEVEIQTMGKDEEAAMNAVVSFIEQEAN